jgi:hypothetical protein
MTHDDWTIYWDCGGDGYYLLTPGREPYDSRDYLILTVHSEGHENGADEKNARTCLAALTKRHFGE